MTTTLFILTLVSAVGVVATLLAGLFLMAKGGAEHGERSNRLMRWRVILQGTTIALFLLTIVSARK